MNLEDFKRIYRRAGLTNNLGFGHFPALLVIDMQIGFTDTNKSSLAGNFDGLIRPINRLISAARAKETPVIFTAIAYEPENQADGGLWVEKVPTLRCIVRGSELAEIDPRLDRGPEDLLVYKNYASAFFGTPLSSFLSEKGIDTLIIIGCTTSGCIRATVVDAISHGFRPIIPLEAVGDRAMEPHEANIRDIQAKYGDVVTMDAVLEYYETL